LDADSDGGRGGGLHTAAAAAAAGLVDAGSAWAPPAAAGMRVRSCSGAGGRVWCNFMTDIYHHALAADAEASSHPVMQNHRGDLSSIMRSFNNITYGKGACVLRMLEAHIGAPAFFRGLRAFTARHQYACAMQSDLWRAIQEACNDIGVQIDVAALMRPWLQEAHSPVI
ncbi:unnamed protein product, partial [Phaeothamnion confervicola]